jgi:hypothetical protein
MLKKIEESLKIVRESLCNQRYSLANIEHVHQSDSVSNAIDENEAALERIEDLLEGLV